MDEPLHSPLRGAELPAVAGPDSGRGPGNGAKETAPPMQGEAPSAAEPREDVQEADPVEEDEAGGQEAELDPEEIDELLEEADNESMIHRFDFGLTMKPRAAAPERAEAPEPDEAVALPEPPLQPPAATGSAAPQRAARPADAEAGGDEDVAGIEELLELEERFDRAFASGDHFGEPHAVRSGGDDDDEEGSPSDDDRDGQALPGLGAPPVPTKDEDERTRLAVLGTWATAPPPATAPKRVAPRKPRSSGARRPLLPRLLVASVVVLLGLTGFVVWLLVADPGTDELAALPEEGDDSALVPGPASGELATPAPDVGPGIEVVGLEVVEHDGAQAARAGTPAAGTTAQPGSTGGRPGTSAGRAGWQPLLLGPELPGWQVRTREGWEFADGTLRLTSGSSKRTAVLITEASYRNVAFTLKALPESAETTFGLLIRAQASGAVRLEFAQGKGILREGERSVPVSWAWPEGEWHQVALIANDRTVLVYVDRRKVGTLPDVSLDSGRLGVYCTAGSVALRTVFAQALD